MDIELKSPSLLNPGDKNDLSFQDHAADAKEKPCKDVPFYKLFKFATGLDLVLIFISVFSATAAGALQPIMLKYLGDASGAFITFASVISNKTLEDKILVAEEELMANVTEFTVATSVLGLVVIISTYISVLTINHSSIRQISKIRSAYMEATLNKDISWYDVNHSGEFSTRIIEDLGKIEEALGDKLSTFLYYISTFFSGLISAFVIDWRLALVCFIYLPLTTVSATVVSVLSSKLLKNEMDAYGVAGAIADEVLGAIRTVIAFDGQQKEINRYKTCLITARENNIKRGLFNAFSNGFMWLFLYGCNGLSFYFGVNKIIDERNLPSSEKVLTPANMITVFFTVLVANWSFGYCQPFFQVFTVAKAAGSKIFSLIEEQPIINLSKGNGKRLEVMNGRIEFEIVYFHYPSRKDVTILRGLDLKISAGETVALVGSSGCGKSTCIQLLQRFYDPLRGRVLIDGEDIKSFDLKWLRQQIGVVGQEPVLFATSIIENIRYGSQYATQLEVEEAAKKANAHNFIIKLPQGYDTVVGERGAQLSGGQKQRIAIARALVRNPTILLLDEATSALDTSSEAHVQAALDNVSKSCTTIIVAHRLSTIRNADKIVVISNGQVVEQGTHDDLVKKKDAYYKLITAQIFKDVASAEPGGDRKENDEILEDEGAEEMSLIPENKEVENVKEGKDVSILRTIGKVLKLNTPEFLHIIIACIGAAIAGAALPIYSIFFGEIVGVLYHPDPIYVRTEGNKICMYFVIIGLVSGTASFIQWYLFSISGEKLTSRVRAKMFESMLKQEMGWYDQKENGTGALCSKLSTNATSVQGASGQSIGTLVNSLSSLGLAIVVSFYIEWRLTLVIMIFVPLIFLSIYFEAKVVNGESFGSKTAMENSLNLAIEAISNIRTVASLGCEHIFYTEYLKELGPHYAAAKRNTHLRGLVLGMARSLIFFLYAASIYYGGILIRDERLEYSIIFKVSEALITGAWAVGNVLAFSPDFQKGVIASAHLMKLFKRVPAIRDGETDKLLKLVDGTVEYKEVEFSYPTRPGVKVLQGLDLNVMHGKTVALVGPSGCGKSTIIQLLERFYDPNYGEVCVDKKSIKTIRLSELRRHLGIVSQEPNLFDRTISENIAYGDNSREVTQEEVINAAKNANIHTFIASLPLGYETRLGDKGTQLSGGQKQRIAIARALVRNPQVLLLDEATSALDTESEKIVQEALDKAKAGRTCITIAHRLLTIQDADVICVIDKGQISELGTHNELLAKNMLYHKMYQMQMGHS